MTDPKDGKNEGFSLIDELYRRSKQEYQQRLSELVDTDIVYVTDLVYCPLKRDFRIRFPELAFTFKPPQVSGSLVHSGLREVLEDNGFEIEKPVETTLSVGDKRIRLKGRIDAYREDVIIEIKTGRPGQQLPHEHHILQLKLYLDLTGVERGLLVYITPDRLVEYDVYPERGLLERLLQEHLDRARTPLWEWECRTCVFADFCHKKKT